MFDERDAYNPAQDALANENFVLREENRRLANPVMQVSTYTAPYPVDNERNMFGDYDLVRWQKGRRSTARLGVDGANHFWIHHKAKDKWTLISERDFEDILKLIFLKSAEHKYTETPL